jgi:hypothetical protein
MGQRLTEHAADEWVTFPGGELEGKRPKALCPSCREALRRAATQGPTTRARQLGRTLCFQCYRADLDRDRAIKAAADLTTTSDARFQFQLPFEPVNRPRLETLKAARRETRAASRADRSASGARADRQRTPRAWTGDAGQRRRRPHHVSSGPRRRTAVARIVAAIRRRTLVSLALAEAPSDLAAARDVRDGVMRTQCAGLAADVGGRTCTDVDTHAILSQPRAELVTRRTTADVVPRTGVGRTALRGM